MSKPDYKNITIGNAKYYGKHTMLTCVSCNENLLDLNKIGQFLKELADDIDMIRYGEPIVARFGEGIQTGISAVQLITTSTLTIHTNDAARDMYLDVFSCKWFTEETVINKVKATFAPQEITEQTVIRR